MTLSDCEPRRSLDALDRNHPRAVAALRPALCKRRYGCRVGHHRPVAAAVPVGIHTAELQDRDGAVPLLASIRRCYPWLRHVFADGGYAGQMLTGALRSLGRWTVQIVKRSDATKRFVVLPRRWVVERTFALARSQPSLGKKFRDNRRERRSLGAYRKHPPHDSAPRKCLKSLAHLRVGL